MDETKAPAAVTANLEGDGSVDGSSGTAQDVQDMKRMGKKQLFRRNFHFFSIFSFTMVLLSTWEGVLGTAAFALGNGGTAGMLYVFLASYIGLLFVIASMAEMASIAPTAGGQYHWISEFAPPSAQRFLSYIVGWLCVLAWQTGVAAGSFLTATEIQGLIVLNYEDSYVYERWHGTLLTIAIVLLASLINTVGIRLLPLIETFGLVLHIGGFLGFIIPVWILGPRADSKAVWTTFSDSGNFGSTGLACLVGILSPLNSTIGADSAAHMSEELKNASKSLPRAMMLTMLFNGALGFIMVATFAYNVGPDLNTVLNTNTGYPFIQLFFDATGSRAATTAITSVVLTMSFLNTVANVAAASRQLFAFARDFGVPFHRFFASVPQNGYVNQVPLNAIVLTVVFTTLLSLINIGSMVAYNQILSLGVAALLSSYLVSIACVGLKRLRGQDMPRSHFTLGRLGLPFNLISTAFLILGFVFVLFPPQVNPSPAEANWAPLIWAAVVIFALVYFFAHGRKEYVGPVKFVKSAD